jgi:hypothetical protein
MKIKFPMFKFLNKTKPFKCLGVVSHGRKCEVQCTLCKRAYAPKK